MKRVTATKVYLLMGAFSVAVPIAHAKLGEGIQLGNLTLRPAISLISTWDSNVHLTDSNEEDDFFLDMVPSVGFVNRTEKLTLRGRGWGRFRRYLNLTDSDSDNYCEQVNAVWNEEERFSLAVTEKYVRFTDYEIRHYTVDRMDLTGENLMVTEDRTERIDRDLFNFAPVVGYRISDKLRANVGYRYNSVNYKDSRYFGWHENRGQLELQRIITDKTSVLMDNQYSEQASDGYTNNSTFYVLRGGFRYEVTQKIAIKWLMGLESYDFGDRSPHGEDMNKDVLSFDFAATWKATDKIQLETIAHNGIQPAAQYQANSKEITLASLVASYDIAKSLTLSVLGSWRLDDYLGKVKDLNDQYLYKKRTLTGGSIRLNYKPKTSFFDVYAESSYENSDTNLMEDEGYEQWRLSLGMVVHY